MVKLRLGLVGLGTWARQGHIPVYRGARLREAVDVVALCGRSAERSQAAALELDIPASFGDFEAMLAQARLDVVAVCTPDHMHTSYVLAALKARCHVLVEKPLAMSTAECAAIMDAAKTANRRVITQYHKRADPLWAEAAKRIRSGAYGALQMGVASIQNPLRVPVGSYFASETASHTDPNWFLGTHFYDLLRFMTDLDPVSVTARAYEGTVKARGVEAIDALKADFNLGGASVSVVLSWNLPEGSAALTKQDMRLHFAHGELDLNGTQRGFVEDGPNGLAYVNPYFLRETAAGPVGYGAACLEEAVLSLLDSDSPRAVTLPSLEDAYWATAMAEAAQHSARAGGKSFPVQPPPAHRA